MDLTLIKGDTHTITFKIKTADDSYFMLQSEDRLYFTVKKNFYTKDVILQKTYKNGITYNAINKEYIIKLNQDCTCDIDCGGYVYDIKIAIAQEDGDFVVKTLVKGSLGFVPNATHKENE